MASLPRAVPALDAIPVPPFASADEYRRFHEALALHVAEVGRATGGPHLETVAIASVISSLARPEPGPDGWAYPSPMALTLALRFFLPVPWTPRTLVESVQVVLPARGMHWTEVTDERIAYFADPEFLATRDRAGAWRVQIIERGKSREDARPENDRAMIAHLADHIIDRFPFPFGWGFDEELRAALAPAAGAVGEYWNAQRRYPFLDTWSAGEAATD